MTKVLVCGLCPLPFENTLRSFGPGIRTWQLARGLAAAGHRVHVLAMKIPAGYEATTAMRRENRDGVTIERLADEQLFDARWLGARIDELQPEALVGATVYGSHALARIDDVAGALTPDQVVAVNLSGRGDKDLATVLEHGDEGGGQ